MSLYITVVGQDVTGYGKQGDIKIASWPSVEGQPARKSECYWNGSVVQLKTTGMLLIEYKKIRLAELVNVIVTRWPEVSRTVAQIKTQYDNIKTDSVNWTTTEEVDDEYDIAIAWLGL